MDELDQNRYATPAEAALLREQLRVDDEAKRLLQHPRLLAQSAVWQKQLAFDNARKALQAAQSTYREILVLEDQVETRMSRARGQLHPLRKLPDEILCEVFRAWRAACTHCDHSGEHGGPICDHVCRQAITVCRWWRRVALGFSELWRAISVRWHRVHASNINNWAAYLEEHQLRSGQLSLDLELYGNWDAFPPDPISATFWSSLKHCFSRARFIGLHANSTVPAPQSLDSCLDQDSPSLRDFRADLVLLTGDDLPLRFFRSAPLLWNVKIAMGIKVAWQSTFPGVTHANIDDIDDARGLLELFFHMPNIISLDVYATDIRSGDVPADFSLRCDQLETLNLTIGDQCDDDMPQRLQFPSLTRAYLSFSDRTSISDSTLTAFLRYPMHTLEELTLDQLEVAMLDGLKFLHKLTTLRFVFYTDTSEDALKALSKAGEHGVWLCPKLIHVTLPVGAHGVYLQEVILNFVHARGPSAWPPEQRPPEHLRSLKLKNALKPLAEPHRSKFTALIDDLLKPASVASGSEASDWSE